MKQRKDILIAANFTAGRDEKINNRFNYLLKMLNADERFKAELVTSSFSHTKKRQRSQLASSDGKESITYVHEPGYKKNVSLKRFYSHYIFGKNVTRYLEKRAKPDAVYCAVPSLSAASACIKYGSRSGVPVILDIQDLWPEAFQILIPFQAAGKLLFSPLRQTANRIYQNADQIVAVSEVYGERAREVRTSKKDKMEFLTVYLGTDFEYFDQIRAKERSPEGKCRVIYAGTIGHNYDLRMVIDAFKLADPDNSKFEFIVMGDGPMLDDLKRYAEKHEVKVGFTGRAPYEETVAMLKSADIGINSIVKGSAVSIINKHADYAAAGLPVISTQEYGGYRELLHKYNGGLTFPAGDAGGVAEGLLTLFSDPDRRKLMGENSRRMGEEKFNRVKTYEKIVQLLLEI